MTEKNEFKVSEALMKSPTFAMSLGAKELFHTNFLAFLLESDIEAIRPISKALKQKLFGINFDGDVWVFRESNNMDLIIVPKKPVSLADYSAVVIEAKLKSIPTAEQLDSYSKRLKKQHFNIGEIECNGEEFKHYTEVFDIGDDCDGYDFLRLAGGDTVQYRRVIKDRKDGQHYKWDSSPGNTKKIRKLILAPTKAHNQASPRSRDDEWEQLSWREIHETLVKALNQADLDDQGTVLLVKSYASDLNEILELLNKTNELVNAFCSGAMRIDFQNFDKLLLDQFKKARLHDLISKYAYWVISEKIQEFLSAYSDQLKYGIHFSRGTPILEIAKKLQNPVGIREIGVQIQDSQYRHFILSRKPDSALREFAVDHLDWFKMVDSETPDKQFNKFDDEKFLYRKKDMKAFTFDDLCNELITSFRSCPDR